MSVTTVYPRVCGGTRSNVPHPSRAMGLSPRVRGNRLTGVIRRRHLGSIPACAGEPNPTGAYGEKSTVYPRVCGGTMCRIGSPPPSSGLSPRVRGNQMQVPVSPSALRSIPACAGEPTLPSTVLSQCTVYPRVCGGTSWLETKTRFLHGLSPRVRGNQHARNVADPFDGSIPACAGEPLLEGSQT